MHYNKVCVLGLSHRVLWNYQFILLGAPVQSNVILP